MIDKDKGVNFVSDQHAGYSNVALKFCVNNVNVTPQMTNDKDWSVNSSIIVLEHGRKIPNKMSKSLQEIQRAAFLCRAELFGRIAPLHYIHPTISIVSEHFENSVSQN